MESSSYAELDGYGVPANCLRLSDQFYGALGRVAALGALVESRMSDVIVGWTSSTDLAGRRMSDLVARFQQIRNERQDVPLQLIDLVADADAAMKERNILIHSVWPSEDAGWKHEARIVKKTVVVRPYATVSTAGEGLSDIVAVIGRLAAVIRPLGNYVSAPAS
jgi:hypothetical protein